ncbi:pathogenicity island protein [Pueribacillus theae]|uniref:pathogenicity island protein n=1 Tax=Pueribacillus theae TaxID=2171751 RepID=UPI001058212C|nr:pathogenicity island protein [Pueribacillus theae]
MAEDEHIRITDSKHLPASLKEKIRENKDVILEALNRDIKAKKAGFMIGLTGKVYTRSLSKNSMVYIEQIGSQWEAWRETYQKGRHRAISVKVICSGSTFEYVLLKAKGYFDYIERKRRERK